MNKYKGAVVRTTASLIAVFSLTLLPAFADSSGLALDSTEKPKKSGTIKVLGESVEYFHKEQKVIGTGNVSIHHGGTLLTADKITVWMESERAIAEGNVVLKEKGNTYKGHRGEYDFKNKVGYVSEMKASFTEDYHGKAEKVERLSEDHYRAHHGYITTCCGDDPLYRIQAREVDIHPGKKIVARNAVLYVKNVPIFFIPYYAHHFVDKDRWPVQIVPGKNSEWGPFVLSKWRYHLIDEPYLTSDGNLLLDYREKRGVGYGIENLYKGEQLGRGSFRFYSIDDKDAPEEINAERYRAQWRHQSLLTQDTTLTFEVNKLSDKDVIKDFFFREEFEQDAFPDNYLSVITAKPEYTLSFLARERLDKFVSVVERSPEIRFDTRTKPFGETPFYFREEVQFSNLERKFIDREDDEQATRLDSNFTLLYAGGMGPVSITPRVGTRQTYYSRDRANEKDVVRGVFDAGVDMSVRYFKVYDVAVHRWGLDYNQIRHVFNPTLSYHYRPNPTVARTTLQQFDSIDDIDKQNFIRFRFENKLQTKHRLENGDLSNPRQIARVIPFFDLDFDSGRVEDVGIDIELYPYPWMHIEGDAHYNTRTSEFETANLDLHFTRGNWELGVGQRYSQDESSQLTAELNYRLNEEWSFKAYERYEFQKKETREFEFTVTKVFSCVIADFTYNHHHDDGDAFFVTIRLKAFPGAAIGLSQSYNRPKTSQAGR